ncbi:hypothetical protein DL767_009635 [Monosporascus sp. MG133]|nr:hypothetical protein DL767_009635 [Monosporascus sp. MG133]
MSYRTVEMSVGNERRRLPEIEYYQDKAEPPGHDVADEDTSPYAPTRRTEPSDSRVGDEDIKRMVRRPTFPTVESIEDLEAQTEDKGEAAFPATDDAGDLSADKNEGGAPTVSGAVKDELRSFGGAQGLVLGIVGATMLDPNHGLGLLLVAIAVGLVRMASVTVTSTSSSNPGFVS